MCSTNVVAPRPLNFKTVDLLVRVGMHSHIGGRMVWTLPRRAYLGPNPAFNWLSDQTILGLICAVVQPHRTQRTPRGTLSRHVTLQVQKSFDSGEIVRRLKVG